MLTITAIMFFIVGYMVRRYQMQIIERVKSTFSGKEESK